VRRALADLPAAKLARVPSLVVVQRVRLEEVIGEQTLQLSAQVADALNVKVGRPPRSRLHSGLNSGFELSFMLFFSKAHAAHVSLSWYPHGNPVQADIPFASAFLYG